LDRQIAEYAAIDHKGEPRRKYDAAAERFVLEHMPTLKISTRARYRCSMRQMAGFANLYLDEFTKTRISDYVSQRRRSGASNATIRRDLALLSMIFTCAIDWGWVENNPVKSFGKQQLRESPPRTTYPTDGDIAKLVTAASPSAARIIKFLAATGMRLEEVCGLEWHQVSIERREVRLTKTKTNAPRTVPLSRDALGTILGTARHPVSPFVFWHGDGHRYRNFSGYFSRLAKRQKVPFRCHDLRHRFASVFLQRTGNLAALQSILGHSTIAMTMRYSHLMTEHLHAAMHDFDTVLGTKVGTGATVYG
jgi:integrase